MKIDRTGCKNTNFQGLEMEVLEYYSSENMTVKFQDGWIRRNVAYKEFKSGSVKNLLHKDIYGVACIGEGQYTARVNKKMSKCYRNWFNMLTMCYGSEDVNVRANTYLNKVTVCEEWLNYQNFAEWFYKNFDPSYMNDWHIDKDLLSGGSLIYSPETCCFIPNEINVIFKSTPASIHGYPMGVSKKDNKFQASISIENKQVYLGLFDTVEEAHEEYLISKKVHISSIAEKWRPVLGDRICDSIKNFDLAKIVNN